MTSNKKVPVAGRAEDPTLTRAQLMGAKRFGYPRDIVAAVLEDGASYTMDQAEKLVHTFLERKVK